MKEVFYLNLLSVSSQNYEQSKSLQSLRRKGGELVQSDYVIVVIVVACRLVCPWALGGGLASFGV